MASISFSQARMASMDSSTCNKILFLNICPPQHITWSCFLVILEKTWTWSISGMHTVVETVFFQGSFGVSSSWGRWMELVIWSKNVDISFKCRAVTKVARNVSTFLRDLTPTKNCHYLQNLCIHSQCVPFSSLPLRILKLNRALFPFWNSFGDIYDMHCASHNKRVTAYQWVPVEFLARKTPKTVDTLFSKHNEITDWTKLWYFSSRLGV